MRNAIFIGFTGTPLLKQDRKTTLELFGQYIHTYKYDEAVADGVVLDLVYEARDVDQRLGSAVSLDELFERRSERLTSWQKAKLKQRWATMQQLLSSHDRMCKIAGDISLDFATRHVLNSGRGNAMLVAASIRDACKYYEIFQNSQISGMRGHVGLVTSYNPDRRDALEDMGDNDESDRAFIYRIYSELLANVPKSANRPVTEIYEEQVKKRFVEQPDQMKLLIVVDKLLTGFDAVPCSYIYLDRHLQDHRLFQAICRTNRVAQDEVDWKACGTIVDYKNLFRQVQNAIAVYTSEVAPPQDGTNPEILLKRRLEFLKQKLEAAREGYKAIMENVPIPRGGEEIRRYFCGDPQNQEDLDSHYPLRELLYQAVARLLRAYANIADELPAAGYEQEQRSRISAEVNQAAETREMIRLASGDELDARGYDADMRDLLDKYVQADESRVISNFGDTPLLEIIAKSGIMEAVKKKFGKLASSQGMAEGLENNLRRVLNDSKGVNPALYEKLSKLLNELIKKRKAGAEAYEKYLRELMEKIVSPLLREKNHWPDSCDTEGKRTLYDNLCQNEKLALQVYDELMRNRFDGWRRNRQKWRKLRNVLSPLLGSDAEAERILALIVNLDEF